MHNKQALILVLMMTLGGCTSLTNTQPVEVVDKSLGQSTLPTQSIEGQPQADRVVFQTSYTTHTAPSQKTQSVPTTPNTHSDAQLSKTWVRPVASRISKTYSDTHQGLTFNTSSGMPVGAIRDAKVIYTSDTMVMLRHTLGFYSIYHHIKPQVKDGQSLDQSQVLGVTTEAPLYVEMKKFKDLINPMPYLK